MPTGISKPTTSNLSAFLSIPAAGSMQVLKYLADFTNSPSQSPIPAPGYTFQPESNTNFGQARMMRVDTRWMSAPIVVSLSDSFSDVVTVNPGEQRLFSLPTPSADTFTVSLAPTLVGLGNMNFGYAKFYFYNFVGVTLDTPRRSDIRIGKVTLGTGTGQGTINISDGAGFGGIPFLKWLRFVSTLQVAGLQVETAQCNFAQIAPFYTTTPPVVDWSFFTIDENTTVYQPLHDHFELDIQIPPSDAGSLPNIANEGTKTYNYNLTFDHLGSDAIGTLNCYAGYYFP